MMKNKMKPRPEDVLSDDFIPLIGYSMQERYTELKESFKIKSKNFDKIRSEHLDIRKMLEEVVQMLKSENKKMKIMLRYVSRDSHSYLHLIKDRESKLKYIHKTPEEMKDSLECRLGHKKNILNMLIYRHRMMNESETTMDKEITFLDRVCGKLDIDKQIADIISQRLTEIEQLMSKARTHSFIKSSYVPILSLLKTELHHFPSRIQNTEKALEHNKKELKEIQLMNKQAKEAKYQSLKQLKQLQEDLAKDRKRRLEVVLVMKKNMGQRADAFEKLRRRKLSVTDMCNEDGNDLRLQLNKARLARFKLNDLFGGIKSTLLETRIMNACQTMLNNDEMNQFQAKRKIQIDKKYKNMQRLIKQALVTKEKLVQSNSSNREKYRAATNEVEVRIEDLKNQIEEKKKKLRNDGELLMNIKKGISALGSKLKWIEVPGLREENSVSEVIMNITARLVKLHHAILTLTLASTGLSTGTAHYIIITKLGTFRPLRTPPNAGMAGRFQSLFRPHFRLDKLQQVNDDLTRNLDKQEMQQDFCLSKLLSKNVDKRYSEEDQTHASDMATTFEDVLEINDDTPIVRNFMKTASRRLIMRQKKK